MKRLLTTTCLLATGSAAMAGPTLMVGISHNFGGATGITVKLLSTNKEDKAAVAAGLTYFPRAQERRWGADVGLGYTFRNGALAFGYDWLNSQWQLSLGAANTRKPLTAPPPAPETLPPPPPPPPEGSGETGGCGPA